MEFLSRPEPNTEMFYHLQNTFVKCLVEPRPITGHDLSTPGSRLVLKWQQFSSTTFATVHCEHVRQEKKKLHIRLSVFVLFG